MYSDDTTQAATSDVAISVNGISKSYKLYDRPSDLIREVITGRPCHRERWALRDISFQIPKGQVVGIIGPNGSGKSTLLKIVTGLLDATSGKVEVNGRLSAILELGTGFHPDISGRDNIHTGGMCLGMSRDEIERKLPWIIEFSELGPVIDQPFRTYSSGMQARLTFSTAIAIDPDILVIDEALAAGDAYFVSKCFKRIRQICQSGATVLFVSHGTGQVAQLCNTAIWLEAGEIRAMGPAREITRRYDYDTHARISNQLGKIVEVEVAAPAASGNDSATPTDDATKDGLDAEQQLVMPVYRRGPVYIDRVTFLTDGDRPETTFRTWDRLKIRVDYHCDEGMPSEDLGLAIAMEREHDLLRVFQINTNNVSGNERMDVENAKKYRPAYLRGSFIADFGEVEVMAGRYLISVGLMPNIPGGVDFFEYHHRTYRITVFDSGYASGATIYPRVAWSNVERE